MIIINEKWAIDVDSSGLNYMPYLWQEAKEVRVVRTGEKKTTEARYAHIGTYYSSFAKALRGILHYEATELGKTNDGIQGYIEKLESIAEDLYQNTLKLKS